MSFRFLVFGGMFGVAIFASLFNPFWGILAYFGHYYVWPEHQWWGEMLAAAGIRVSLLISTVTAAGVAIHWQTLKSKIAGPMLHSQEVLFWGFVAAIGVSRLWGLPLDSSLSDASTGLFPKMAKVGVFLFMLTHVVTTPRELIRLLQFAMIVGGVYLAWEAYTAPESAYQNQRLEGIGGPDFEDSNFGGAHFVVMGILAGIGLISHGNLIYRFGCLLAGGLIANAVVLTQSRGAFLGIVTGGTAALAVADRRTRKYILLMLPLIVLGGYRIADGKFRERMTTIVAEGDDRDASAGNRLVLWKAAAEIFRDHPLGVGVGNFYSVIGLYRFELAGRDAHSTYMRCLAELGIFGAVAMAALFINALRTLRWCQRTAAELGDRDELVHVSIGLQVAIIAFATCGLTITMTYCEELYIFLLLPVCCYRAVRYAQQESQSPTGLVIVGAA